MSKSSDLQREVDRWKDKYFEQSETFEEDKRFAEEYASLLQRLLVRVSLAADSVNDSLDRELSGLRSAIREASPRQNDLAKRLKHIDDLILNVDESKQKNAQKVVDSLNNMVEQLLSLDLPRAQKRALKKLAKSFESRARNFKEYPGILSEYALLQAESLKHAVSDEKRDGGFFSRFMKGGGKEPSETKSDPEQESTEQSDLDIGVDAGEAVETEIVPGFAGIAVQVSNTIGALLDQLAIPETAVRDEEKLRAKLSRPLNWYELGPMLDDLANLVVSALGRGQRDLQKFLLVLDDRLSRVQKFLVRSRESDLQWHQRNQQLDTVMRTQVSEISIQVSQADELEELKLSITDHLEQIGKAMDSFTEEEAGHMSARDQELQEMQQRLSAMEEETAHMRQRLKEERGRALRDSLTDLPNREAYDERLELEIERWKRYKKPAVLVVADIDYFKSVNDKYGHLSGDKVLQIMGKEIRNRIRKTDFVARYGGEEFVIILPETDGQMAEQVIDKTRDMISRLPFHFREEKVQMTVSFGIVAFDEGCTADNLFERADEALYQAKKNGRNRVEVWQSE